MIKGSWCWLFLKFRVALLEYGYRLRGNCLRCQNFICKELVLQSDFSYFSTSDWSTFDFCSTMWPTCCKSPRRCTPVKYRRDKRLGINLSHRQPPKFIKLITQFLKKPSSHSLDKTNKKRMGKIQMLNIFWINIY